MGDVVYPKTVLTEVNVVDYAGEHLSDDGTNQLSVDDDFVENTGDDITGSLNFANSDSIQDAGTDVIQFDGAQNITVPNGTLEVGNTDIRDDATIINSVSTGFLEISELGGAQLSAQGSITLDTDEGDILTLDAGVADFSGMGINLANSDSIQDAGTDAIQFDGSQNVTLPNGNLVLTGGDYLELPQVSADPGAPVGSIYYRSDLD